MSKRMPPGHRRQMMKENRCSDACTEVSASEVDAPNNSTFPPNKFFRIGSVKTVETYPSL